MTMNKKEINRITKAIESVGVIVMSYELNKHIKFTVVNPKTGTEKLVVVSGSPKFKGIYHEIKSSVRKVFRKEGEVL